MNLQRNIINIIIVKLDLFIIVCPLTLCIFLIMRLAYYFKLNFYKMKQNIKYDRIISYEFLASSKIKWTYSLYPPILHTGFVRVYADVTWSKEYNYKFIIDNISYDSEANIRFIRHWSKPYIFI